MKSLIDLWNPANSESGTSWFGIGPPFVIAVAFLVAGVVAMIVSQVIQPSFFRRKTETAETMSPTPEGVIFNDSSRAACGLRTARGRRPPAPRRRPRRP